MGTNAIDPPIPVAVAATSTPMATLDVRSTDTLTVQVTNLDGAATLDCTVQRRATGSNAFVDSSVPDLQGVAPGATACVDLDCAANADIRIIGISSSGTINTTIGVRDKPRRRP